MRRLGSILLTLLLVTWPLALPQAARDTSTDPSGHSGLQLLVMETPDCIYCKIFRRDVAPTYQASVRAERIPMRFLDINNVSEADLGLTSPVTIVPTVVLVENNKEIGRINGYIGPENFYHSVNYMLGTIGHDNSADSDF